MKHEMSLYKEPFFNIKTGKKLIEVRLNDIKRQKVAIGDVIEFSLLEGNEKISVKVIGLSRFSSFRDFYSTFNYKMFAHPKGITVDEQIQRERDYYSEERENEFGVLGIHIKLL